MNKYIIGLGSSEPLGNQYFSQALDCLAVNHHVDAVSEIIYTHGVDTPQPLMFFNAAFALRSMLNPHELMNELLDIEAKCGRIRREINGPRTLDLDILWFYGSFLSTADLEIPHPRLLRRRFALQPAVQAMSQAGWDIPTIFLDSLAKIDHEPMMDMGALIT